MLKTLAFITLAGLILTRQLVPLGKLIIEFPLNDFSVYRDGIAATLRGNNPYTQWFFDRYNYSPAATILFSPLSYLPINLAEATFTLLSLISLWLALTYVLYSLQFKLTLAPKIFIYALLVKFYPAKLTLILGQVNLIVLCLIVASYYWQLRRRPKFAGVLLGLATVLKLYPGFLFTFYLMKKSFRTIVTGLATIVILHFVAILLFGWPLTLHYYSQVVPQLLTQSVNATYMNQGLTSLFARFGVFGTAATLIRYLLSGSLLIWLFTHFPKNMLKQFSWYALLLIVVTLILPVFVWQHHFVFVIPGLFLLLNHPFLAGLFYLLLNLYFRNPNLPTQQHPLIATHFLLLTLVLTLILLVDLTPRRRQP